MISEFIVRFDGETDTVSLVFEDFTYVCPHLEGKAMVQFLAGYINRAYALKEGTQDNGKTEE